MVHDPDAVVARALAMVRDRSVTAVSGERVGVDARSLCLHGDTPGAAGLALRVRRELLAAGVVLEPFA